jgi:uncharacterized secreted protein with C-terminal beta-propeller domain
MKIPQRIILTCSALTVAAAVFLAATAPPPPGERMVSDGRTIPISRIDAVRVVEDTAGLNTLPAVGNMETLLKLLRERGALYDGSQDRNGWGRGLEVSASESAMATPGGDMALTSGNMAGDSGAGAMGGGTDDYSATNEQVEGVSEGDIVKTDGRYLYALSGNTLRIIAVNGADMNVVSSISFDDMWGAEFYLIGDKIAVIGQKYMPYYDIMPRGGGLISDMMYRGGSSFTVLTVYDISDRSSPVEERRVEMEGWSVATRVIGDVAYIVTNKHVWGIPYEQADSLYILPCYVDTGVSDEVSSVSLERIYYLPGTEDASYLIIGAVDIVNGGAFEPEAYLGAGNMVYMSRDNLYISVNRWEETGDRDQWGWDRGRMFTEVMRFAVSGTKVTYAGMGRVDGTPINQYSMDEYNGFFRIATTDWSAGTLVTVMDMDMRIAGQTGYMAPGEWMQSMRFMGDMGYVVTFEMVDPLFTIDLSDPYRPRVLGELKIPGFSQYLHPVGENLLMGIGRDTQEIYTRDRNGVETVTGFIDTGLKISLFDVSDPYDPLEVHVLTLGQGWTEVSHNPRALLADAARGLYGFTFDSWDENWHNVSSSALIVSVDGRNLSIAANIDITQPGYYYSWSSRLSFIGNTLYLTHQNGVAAYDYNTFSFMSSLTF